MSSLLTLKKIATSLLVVLVLGFLITTQWLNVGTHFSISPDEAANRMFAERIANGESIAIEVPAEITEAGDNGVHPRSTLSVDGNVVPTSFMGMPMLYGAIGWLLGSWVIPYLTVIIALCGVVAWALLIRYLAKSNLIGLLSGALVLITPGYWFYTGRAMMHNVPFVAFLMIAAWLGVVKPLGKWSTPLAGLALGIGMAMRTGEVIWVAALVAILVVVAMIKKWWTLTELIGFVVAGLLIAISMGLVQQQVYGSFFETGYTLQPTYTVTPQEPPAPPTQVTQADYPGVLGILFPFGIHERAILRNSINYLFAIQIVPSVIALCGLFFVGVIAGKKVLEDGPKKAIRHFGAWEYLALVAIAISVWLVVVYGSWVFYDNANKELVTIGNSYVRYWLPIYIVMTPFLALALSLGWENIEKISKKHAPLLQPIWAVVVAVCLVALSAGTVFSGDDGFMNARSVLQTAESQVEQVLDLTEENAVIIVDTEDKYLYPERQVLVPLRTERTYALMPRIAKVAPLYYYGISLPEKDLEYLNTEKLAENDLQIELVSVVDDKSLYLITFRNP